MFIVVIKINTIYALKKTNISNSFTQIMTNDGKQITTNKNE